MIDIDELERHAKAAGSGEWTASDRIVWFDDGDSAMQVMNPIPVFITHDNLGTWPDPIAAEDVATFAAIVCPAAILTLIEEVRALREDAERYRWIRGLENNGFPLGGSFCMGNFQVSQKVREGEAHYYYGCALDAAIDASRAKEKA
jgi:hypothetical protein